MDYTLTPAGMAEGGQEWQEMEVVTAIYENHREVLAVDERRIFGEFASV